MIQKEKIRDMGYFLAALAAGLLPFAAPERCAQALREGLALCGGSLLLSLFPFLIVSTLLIQCPAAGVLGLPFYPVERLIGVLQRLVAAGNSVLVIEHNLDVIKTADYLIDLGPEGGDGGGKIVAVGTPEEVVRCKKSYTGQYLAPILKRDRERMEKRKNERE
mgnify:CR=1 FL=1